jgi:hypothetical protein
MAATTPTGTRIVNAALAAGGGRHRDLLAGDPDRFLRRQPHGGHRPGDLGVRVGGREAGLGHVDLADLLPARRQQPGRLAEDVLPAGGRQRVLRGRGRGRHRRLDVAGPGLLDGG